MEENGYEPQSTASLVAKAPKDSPKLKRNNQPICKWEKKKTVVPDFTREIGRKWKQMERGLESFVIKKCKTMSEIQQPII